MSGMRSIDYDILALAIIKHSPHKTQEQSDPLPEDHTGHAVISLPPESFQDINSPVSLAGLFFSQLRSSFFRSAVKILDYFSLC